MKFTRAMRYIRTRRAFFLAALIAALCFEFPVASIPPGLQAQTPEASASAQEIARIRAAYRKAATAIQAGDSPDDLKKLSLEFDRILPGSGPQRMRARFYFQEAYTEQAGGGSGQPRFRAKPIKVELRYNFAAREFYREVFYMQGAPRFVFSREGTGEERLEDRLYFDSRRRLVVRTESKGGGPAKARDGDALSAADRKAGRAALDLARDCARILDQALALPGT